MKKIAIRQELEAKLKGRSAPERRILFVGILNKYLKPSTRAVLVGGALVEFYTRGAYVTGDVDLIGEKDAVRRLLAPAGFQEEGRYFFRDDLGIVAEVPSSTRRASETVVESEFEGYRVPMVSVEDAIVDRLLAAKYWRSPTDWEQSILLFRAQRNAIDADVLRKKARVNEVEDKVDELFALEREMGKKPARLRDSPPKGRA